MSNKYQRHLMNRTNDFTKECDKYLIEPWVGLCKEGYCETVLAYFLEDVKQLPCQVAFRFPGATRGHILVDAQGCLSDIAFYDTAWWVYSRALVEVAETCKGWPIFSDFVSR